ncbi:hypothetical protein [uncultured Sphingomonas sp.]|nr:hypothetical protein [uncultured Sphingomonas sp.]
MILTMLNQRRDGDHAGRPLLRVQAVIDHLAQALAKASWAGT